MVLFEEQYLKIEFKNVPFRHLVATWTGVTKSQPYKDGYNTVLRCCRENDIKKVLSDVRKQAGVARIDKSYVENMLIEYVRRNGELFHAVVVPNDIFVEFSSENFDRNNRDFGLLKQYFSNDKEAMQWLEQVDT